MCNCNKMKSQAPCKCCCSKDSKKECGPKEKEMHNKQDGHAARKEGESNEARNRNKTAHE